MQTKRYRYALIPSLSGFCILALLASAFNPHSSGHSLFVTFCGVAAILICLPLAVRDFREQGADDPFGWFVISFAAYNALMLLQIGITASTEGLLFSSSDTSAPANFIMAGVSSLLAAIGIGIGSWYNRSRRPHWRRALAGLHQAPPGKAMFALGFSTFCIGFAFQSLKFRAAGGFLSALTMDRKERAASMFIDLPIAIPDTSFILAGAALMLIGYRVNSSRPRLAVLLTALFFFVIINLVQGERRLVVYLLLTSISLYNSTGLSPLRFNRKILLSCAVLIFLFAVISQSRYLFPEIASGRLGIQEGAQQIVLGTSVNTFLPGRNEFFGPFYSLTMTVNNSETPTFGRTYLEAALWVLPTMFYPGNKGESLAQQFAERMHIDYFSDNDYRTGWGFSPVAEAFINFGLIGIPLVFACWATAWQMISRMRYRNCWGVLASALALPQTINIQRMSLDMCLQEVLFAIAIAAILFKMARIFGTAQSVQNRAVCGAHSFCLRRNAHTP